MVKMQIRGFHLTVTKCHYNASCHRRKRWWTYDPIQKQQLLGKENRNYTQIYFSYSFYLVYMSVTNYDGNNQLIQYVQEHIANTKNYIIVGDFNGHTGFLGPQSMNKNGYIMLDLIDKNNLILLNGHPKCKGGIIWQQRERKSTINLIIDT